MTDKDETKRLERATLDIEKLKVNYWSLWQELGEIRKEIEGLNRAKEGEEQDQREWKYGMVKWSNEIDELITRHKATLDLLAKPKVYPYVLSDAQIKAEAESVKKIVDKVEKLMAQYAYEIPRMAQEEIESADKTMNEWKPEPGPAECGCIDKAKLIHSLDCRANAHKRQGDKVERENRPELAAKLYIREELFRGLIDRINEGEYDRAPCKPEPAPCDKCESGEVIALTPGGKATVRLPSGYVVEWRSRVSMEDIKPAQGGTGSDPEKKCTPTKPALDKGALLGSLRRWVAPGPGIPTEREPGYLRIIDLLERGTYDLPATDRPREEKREHKCRCSTSNLVEQLRSRASVADGIDVTDLDADQLLTVGWNRPATVIMVRKEGDRS